MNGRHERRPPRRDDDPNPYSDDEERRGDEMNSEEEQSGTGWGPSGGDRGPRFGPYGPGGGSGSGGGSGQGPGGPQRPPRNLFEFLTLLMRNAAEKRTASSQGGPKKPRRKLSKRGLTVILLVAGIPILLVIAAIAAGVWTDVLWYQEVGFAQVFWTRIWARVLVALAGGALFFVVFFGNVYLARRLSPKLRAVGGEENVLEVVPLSDRRVLRLLVIASLVVTFFFVVAAGNKWQEVLLFLNRTSFGWSDPIFGRDASFFIFVLPMARYVLSFLTITLVLTLLATLGVYLFDQAITLVDGRRLRLAAHVKAHLSTLAAALLLTKAIDYLLDAYDLVLSPRGVIFGAGYTDVHADLPVLRILAAVAAISAVIFLINIYYRGWRLPLVAVGLLVVMWIVAGQIYPALIQQWRVSPNEISAEEPYIADNIEATRFAYNLDQVDQLLFPAEQQLTAADIKANEATVSNIRLWDPRPLIDTYAALQELRLYYAFRDIDVDRYTLDGDYSQVMLAGRELEQSKLQEQSKTWVNLHLTYTHGYGVVMSRVDGATSEGLPEFYVSNIPPMSTTDVEVTRPAIYYGEAGNNYVLVKTTAREFDYPQGNENVFTTYEGTGGVGIGSPLRQVAFALRFATLKLLFSDYLQADSRIMYRRTINERVQAIAPFLQFDRDPYLVVRDDGTLVWIWDAYTAADRFPYSQPSDTGLNYARNSIKVVIDAYNGDVTLYQVDPDDAVANTWGKVFPGIFVPGDQMPEDLRRHLRYPEDLFRLQAGVLSVYHMEDPQVFYNKEDVWEIPMELYASEKIPVDPYYVNMALPGESDAEFLLLQPFTPLQKENMIAWMAARMDAPHYGEIVIFEFSKDRLAYGPSQIEARISNDPQISAQLTLWDQSGSRVIRGNLLVIPIEDSLIYVEPLYLQAEQTQQTPIPALTRVIVIYKDAVVMEPTLAEALDALFGGPGGIPTTTSTTAPSETTTTTTSGQVTTTTVPGQTTSTLPGTGTTTTLPGAPLPTDPAALTYLAQQHYLDALDAQKAGDWAEYGRQIEELGRVLEALAALSP